MFLLNFNKLNLQTLKDLWTDYQEVCIIVLGVVVLLFLLWIIAIICSKKNKKRYKKLVKLNLQKEIEVQQSLSQEEQPVVEEETEESVSEEQPVEEQPVEEQPVVEDEVVEDEVVEDEVVEEQPVEEQPVEEQPVEEQPVEEQPVEEQPVEEQPVEEQPVVEDKPVKKSPAKKAAAKTVKSQVKETVKEEPKEEPKEEIKEEPTAPAKKPTNRGKGKYEIVQDAAGFNYSLKASNGEILIVSESYTTLAGCKNAIKRLQKNAHEATVNIEKDKNGNFQFHIVKGTSTIAHSANYSTKVSATNASKAFLKYIDTDVIKVIEESSNDLEEVIVDNNDISTDTIGKIVISKDGSNYLYKLYANNGQVICMSPVYKTLTTIEKSIATFKESVYDGKFFMLKDKNDNYQFKLYSKTNRLVMTGESFQSADACRSNVVSCHRFAKNAPVEYPEE